MNETKKLIKQRLFRRIYEMRSSGKTFGDINKDEFVKQVSGKDLEIADLKVRLKDEEERADLWKEKYENLRDSQDNKKFRGKLSS